MRRVLSDVPAIATSGDRFIELQNGDSAGSPGHQLPGLLTFGERRRARKRAIISLERARGYGGYGGSRVVPLEPPRWVGVVSIAGPQFEVGYLESRDFIIAPAEWHDDHFPPGEEAPPTEPLFPHYYPEVVLTRSEAEAPLVQFASTRNIVCLLYTSPSPRD